MVPCVLPRKAWTGARRDAELGKVGDSLLPFLHTCKRTAIPASWKGVCISCEILLVSRLGIKILLLGLGLPLQVHSEPWESHWDPHKNNVLKSIHIYSLLSVMLSSLVSVLFAFSILISMSFFPRLCPYSNSSLMPSRFLLTSALTLFTWYSI